MTTYDFMIRAETYLENKFEMMADDLISEGYVIERSPEFHTAMVEFVADAMTYIAATMVDNPRGDSESIESYIDDMVEDFADTSMDDMIKEKLEQHFME